MSGVPGVFRVLSCARRAHQHEGYSPPRCSVWCERCGPECPHQGTRKDPGCRQGNCKSVRVVSLLIQHHFLVTVRPTEKGGQPYFTSTDEKFHISRSWMNICHSIASFFQIFNHLPVRKMTYIPNEIEDPNPCLPVRPKRSFLPYPEDKTDPHTVFQVLSKTS